MSIPLNQSECIFPRNSRVQMTLCAMLLRRIAHSVICTLLFRRKIHYDWFNGIDILQSKWQHGEKLGYSYPNRLEKTLCKWGMYVPLVTKGLIGYHFLKSQVCGLRLTPLYLVHILALKSLYRINTDKYTYIFLNHYFCFTLYVNATL
jgi:hypothetical protein